MKINSYHINTFTDQLFHGNPACVCLLENWLPEKILRQIAMENQLPATTFLVAVEGGFETRWFTPEYEIDLCGHGSLASAHVIFKYLKPELSITTLIYPAGKIIVTTTNDLHTLDLPEKNAEMFSSDVLPAGLGVQPKEIYQYKNERCLAVLETEAEVRALRPNLAKLKELPHRGVIVTAPSNQYDFVSRTFYPNKAASEDAVTGSSHCLLVPYWAKRLQKNSLHGYQASHRGGELRCKLDNDKVQISGKAILYAQGVVHL